MASIEDRETVDTIIKGNGIYPGDEAYPVVKIVQYRSPYHDRPVYGLIYDGESLNKYAESPYVLEPKIIFERTSMEVHD